MRSGFGNPRGRRGLVFRVVKAVANRHSPRVGQEPRGPAGAAIGRGGKGRGDEPGLPPAVELGAVLASRGAVRAQGRLQALPDEAATDPLHRRIDDARVKLTSIYADIKT